MGEEPVVHRAISADGTEIAGRLHGQGSPLVLVHGGLGDGEGSWEPLLPYLTDRFTCYTMSTRCRRLSGQSSDLSPQRLIEDVTAFAESIGEPVGLVGLSTTWTLGAAAHTDAVVPSPSTSRAWTRCSARTIPSGSKRCIHASVRLPPRGGSPMQPGN